MNIWNQERSSIRPRHRLGLYLPTAKLASRGYVPSRKDRVQMRGRRPFWFAFGEVALAANQWTELRQVCQSDFIAHTIMVSATQSSQASPGCRVQIQNLSTMPGKGRKFSTVGVNNVNVGGSSQHPFILKKPYRFHAGRTVVVKIQNLRGSSNNVQVVIGGVIDE